MKKAEKHSSAKKNKKEEALTLEKEGLQEETARDSSGTEILGEQEPEVKQPTLEDTIKDLEDAHLRLRAEYDNYRKRTLKEKSDLIKYATEKCLLNFLEVMDDLDRALENISEEDKVVDEGFKLVHAKMLGKLRSEGVVAMEVLGQEFDADVHEAIALVPVDDPNQKGKILDCVLKGYTLNDKVLRHPKVVVAQ